ncbi:MAG TPA: precorrin-6y C5,15-methyltransferase (decarboxylating) subunit CbiE [Desulfovibrio sp.]|uniref:precorrin-6y C5,15-methyltransferase (decarboxylating) subunit CbiE n=1 Tax=Desulfovibrio sp. TaxID=885 RepID=UPI002D5E55EB|nr:precorrin-6y C5,15-methyltransferase (decarboxylating) subunit CbiE [Desulfovibrio sp.]HZF61653.1 precorrin-6y C5,15-methyltransferase (decarboxylating) subunit CbiE [Desulfovibrio sp.]
MKQQVSLPGFAVPPHTPDTPTRDDDATNAVQAEALAVCPVERPDEHPADQPLAHTPADVDVHVDDHAAADMPAELPAESAVAAVTTTLAASITQAAPAAESAPAAPATPAATPASPPVAGTSEQDDWPPMSEMLQSFFVFEPTTVAPEPITVMGLDCARPRGLAGLAEAQRQLAEQADVICAGRMLLEEFSGRSLETNSNAATGAATSTAEEPSTEDQPAHDQTSGCQDAAPAAGPALKARLLPLTTPLEPLLTRLSQLRAAGERVLVLADGDPLLFGIGATLVRRMGPDAVRLLPAVSSLQQACARLSLPWHKVICLSLHGRDDLRPLNVACGKNAPLCILTDARMSPDVLARHLLDRGVDWFDAHIFERMGAADECVSHLSMADAAGREFGPACTMVLIPMAPARRPHLGLDADQLAVDRGLISKKPVRAAALALLRIEAGHVVWDLGSGSGAVALEASVLAHEGRVIAVERSAGRAMGIQENRRRFGAANVEVRLGQAPECLPGLPDPQRVFIGGGLSGDDGDDILGHVCLRLPVGGRVVVSCVLLDSFSLCRRFFEDMGWPVEILQLSAAEGKSLGGDVHLAAMNPVFLLAAQKPAPAPIQSGAQPEGR